MSLILLRHAQPKSFSGPWIQPHPNPLSNEGVEQAEKFSNSIRDKNIEVIYSSPYTRALQTAKIIGNNLGLKVNVKDNLKERDQGDLENQSLPETKINELWKKFDEFKTLSEKEQWKTTPFAGFESDGKLLERALNCLSEISQENSEKVTLIVTHASLIKVLLIHFRKVKLEERDSFKIKELDFFEI